MVHRVTKSQTQLKRLSIHYTYTYTYTNTYTYTYTCFPGSSVVKNLPAKQETWAQSLGWEDPLEKEMATLPSILACEIPWTEEPGRLQSMESRRVGHNAIIHKYIQLHPCTEGAFQLVADATMPLHVGFSMSFYMGLFET